MHAHTHTPLTLTHVHAHSCTRAHIPIKHAHAPTPKLTATVSEPSRGITLEILTTAPGLQFYSECLEYVCLLVL